MVDLNDKMAHTVGEHGAALCLASDASNCTTLRVDGGTP